MFPNLNILVSNLLLPTIILSILIFCGFVLTRFLPSQNKLLTLGSSMILGPLGLLFLLSIFSYAFKGKYAVFAIFLFYFLICLWLFLKRIRLLNLKKILAVLIPRKQILLLVIVLFYLWILFMYTHRSRIGADFDIYWSIATSFTLGNYPTVSSWQPNFLTVYHQGAFMIEGAINLLSKSRIDLTHYFFSFYTISAIFIMLVGLALDKKYIIFSLIPAIFALFLFGGPIILTSGLSSFLQNLSSLETLAKYSDFGAFGGANGGGATDLQGLIYVNFYTFGLGSFLLFINLLKEIHAKSKLKDYLILVVFLTLLASIDETFFLAGLPLFFLSFLWNNRVFGVLLTLILVALLAIIQNPIRDSILTSSPETPRFKLLFEIQPPLLSQFFYKRGEIINWNGVSTGQTAPSLAESRLGYAAFRQVLSQETSWVIFDLTILNLILLASLLVKPSKLIFLLCLSSLVSLILSIFLINTFWPPNALRITNQGYQLALIALGLQLVAFIRSEAKVLKIISTVILIILLPQIIVSHAKVFNMVLNIDEHNFTKPKKDLLLEAISRSIPAGKITIYLDGYPTPASHPYYNYTSLIYFGVFVPLSPPLTKILNPAPGIEFLDAVNSLSPTALKKLNIEYVYVQNVALFRLSQERKNQLKNKEYFQPVRTFEDDGTLYIVKESFKNLADNEPSLGNMVKIIGENKRVYLDKLTLPEVRKSLILALSKNNHLIGPPHAHGGDFYMYIETILPYDAICDGSNCPPTDLRTIKNLDFTLLDFKKDPNEIFSNSFRRVLETPYVTLWQTIEGKI